MRLGPGRLLRYGWTNNLALKVRCPHDLLTSTNAMIFQQHEMATLEAGHQPVSGSLLRLISLRFRNDRSEPSA